MEAISLKLDEKMLRNIDKTLKEHNYSTRTEFIRDAIRHALEDVKMKEAMGEIAHLKGASRKKTTDQDLERIRAKAFDSLVRH